MNNAGKKKNKKKKNFKKMNLPRVGFFLLKKKGALVMRFLRRWYKEVVAQIARFWWGTEILLQGKSIGENGMT